jgi:chorismate mutase
MAVRGIRGAITVTSNTGEEIVDRSKYMLEEVVRRNDLQVEDVVSAFFTVTPDLDAQFPAVAARHLGWLYTPLMCASEIPVKGSLEMCIRVLIHVNSRKTQEEMVHCYLDGASVLRPDLDTDSKDKYYISES